MVRTTPGRGEKKKNKKDMTLMVNLIFFESLNSLEFHLNLARNWMEDRRLTVRNLINFKNCSWVHFFFPARGSLLLWKMLCPTCSLEVKTELSTGMDAAFNYYLMCFCCVHRKQNKFQTPACTGWLSTVLYLILCLRGGGGK